MSQPTAKQILEMVDGSSCVGGKLIAKIDGENVELAELTTDGVVLSEPTLELWNLEQDRAKAKAKPAPKAKTKPASK